MKNYYKAGYLDCINDIILEAERVCDSMGIATFSKDTLITQLRELMDVKDAEFDDIVDDEDIDNLSEVGILNIMKGNSEED